MQIARGISEEEIRQAGGQTVVEKGPLNGEWLQSVLRVIDTHVQHGIEGYLDDQDVARRIHEALVAR